MQRSRDGGIHRRGFGRTQLFGRNLKLEIQLGVAVFHFNFLGNLASLAVQGFNSVFASGNAGDLEASILAGDGEVRTVHNSHIREHPGMNVAFEFQEVFLCGETDHQIRSSAHLSLVHHRRLVAISSGLDVDVVKQIV